MKLLIEIDVDTEVYDKGGKDLTEALEVFPGIRVLKIKGQSPYRESLAPPTNVDGAGDSEEAIVSEQNREGEVRKCPKHDIMVTIEECNCCEEYGVAGCRIEDASVTPKKEGL